MTPQLNAENTVDHDPKSGQFRPGNRAAAGRGKKRERLARAVASLRRRIATSVERERDSLVKSALDNLRRGNAGPLHGLLALIQQVESETLAARLDELEKRLDSAHGVGVAGRVGNKAA